MPFVLYVWTESLRFGWGLPLCVLGPGLFLVVVPRNLNLTENICHFFPPSALTFPTLSACCGKCSGLHGFFVLWFFGGRRKPLAHSVKIQLYCAPSVCYERHCCAFSCTVFAEQGIVFIARHRMLKLYCVLFSRCVVSRCFWSEPMLILLFLTHTSLPLCFREFDMCHQHHLGSSLEFFLPATRHIPINLESKCHCLCPWLQWACPVCMIWSELRILEEVPDLRLSFAWLRRAVFRRIFLLMLGRGLTRAFLVWAAAELLFALPLLLSPFRRFFPMLVLSLRRLFLGLFSVLFPAAAARFRVRKVTCFLRFVLDCVRFVQLLSLFFVVVPEMRMRPLGRVLFLL